MAMLEIKDLEVYYGMIKAIKGVSFEVNEGEVIALIGANGAGKTTILHTITGLLEAKKGSVFFDGKDITKVPAHKIVSMGMAHVPEGRRVFANLTVLQNLKMGAYTRKDKNEIEELKKIFSTMIKIQNEFTLRDDVLYIILKEFVANVENRGKRFTSAQLYEEFIKIAVTKSLIKPFEQVYKNPKSVSTRLKNIKNNLSDEIIIKTQKGHANVTYYSFSFVDENKYQDLI